MYSCFDVMRKLLSVIIIILFAGQLAAAQGASDDEKTWGQEWKYAFSSEGRKDWHPEFTVRYNNGLFVGGIAVSAGVRIDDKRTMGIMGGKADAYMDAVPGDMYEAIGGLSFRRYFHLGKKQIFSFYSDLAVGAGYCYAISGNFSDDVRPVYEQGEFFPFVIWQPGIRIRFWRNVHFFLGGTFSVNSLGVHLGIGF